MGSYASRQLLTDIEKRLFSVNIDYDPESKDQALINSETTNKLVND
jgi:hypothetical protein